jgi:hypothetical protein
MTSWPRTWKLSIVGVEVLHPARSRGVHRLDEKGDVEREGVFQLLLHERAVVCDGCDLDIGAGERGDFVAEGLREMRLDLPVQGHHRRARWSASGYEIRFPSGTLRDRQCAIRCRLHLLLQIRTKVLNGDGPPRTERNRRLRLKRATRWRPLFPMERCGKSLSISMRRPPGFERPPTLLDPRPCTGETLTGLRPRSASPLRAFKATIMASCLKCPPWRKRGKHTTPTRF